MFLDEETRTLSRDGSGEFEFNPRRIRAGRGGGGRVAPHAKVFWSFFWTIKHQNLTFSVAVPLSLPRILRQV